MKKFTAAAAALMVLCQSAAYAADGISVELNGRRLEFETEPQIINERTMVPMRKIFEELGAQVSWIEEHQMIVASSGTKLVLLQIGQSAIITNDVISGTQERTELDTAPVIVDDSTLVPVRAVSEALDAEVQWDDASRTVKIISK